MVKDQLCKHTIQESNLQFLSLKDGKGSWDDLRCTDHKTSIIVSSQILQNVSLTDAGLSR